MKLLCLFFTITIFEIVNLKTVPLGAQIWTTYCPNECLCDHFENIVQCTNASLSEIPDEIDKNVSTKLKQR